MTSPVLGGGRTFHMILWWCYIIGIRDAPSNMLWRSTDAQLHTFHAATCRNASEQFDSCNNLSDVKITPPAFGGCNAHYMTSSGATELEFGESK